MNPKQTAFTILGGGIAGLSAAIALQNIGIEAMVFESAPEIRPVGAGLGLAANAMKAFRHLGIHDDIVAAGRQLKKFTIYDERGRAITTTSTEKLDEKHGITNFTIHRAELHKVLLSKLPAHQVITAKRCLHFKRSENGYVITFEDGTTWATQYLIAADGIHSAVRKSILPQSKIRYAGYTCWRGIVDNTELKISETSETWGPNGRFGIVPLAHDKIYWFATRKASQNDDRLRSYKSAELLGLFSGYHAPIADILAATKDDAIIWSDICDLQPISQYAFDDLLLMGDAAHATTPNLGQGACQAIEDAAVLGECLKKNSLVAQAFKSFERMRLRRTHQIVNQSWQLGKIAQVENRLAGRIRNSLFRMMPASINEKQLDKIYQVDFDLNAARR